MNTADLSHKDSTVLHFQNAVKDVERAVIVCHDEDAGIPLVGDFGEKLHDLTPSMAVESGGGLVGEDEAGIVREGSGDGDPLLLSAGKSDRKIVRAFADPEVIQQFSGPFAGRPGSGVIDLQRNLHVLERRQERNEIRFLKHETEVPAAEGPQVHERARTVEHRRAIDRDPA